MLSQSLGYLSSYDETIGQHVITSYWNILNKLTQTSASDEYLTRVLSEKVRTRFGVGAQAAGGPQLMLSADA